MLVEIFFKTENGDWALKWEEPAPGSTTSSKLMAVVMQVIDKI